MSKSHRTPQQVAALPMMVDGLGGLRVLLITSRETKRWVIPKGWPMRGIKNWDAAAIEARQEAGLVGKVKNKPLGTFVYFKRLSDRFELIEVTVYPLLVKREMDDWPERKERQSFWLAPRIAADMVQEPDLAAIIRGVEAEERGKTKTPAGMATGVIPRCGSSHPHPAVE